MVLGRLQGDDRLPIGDGQHAGLLAVEPLLDHQPCAGLAKEPLPGDFLDRLQGLKTPGTDDNPFAGSQPVGFDYGRHVLAVLEVLDRMVGIAEGLVLGARNGGAAEEVFAKDLAGFQLGGRLVGAKNQQMGRFKGIDDPGRQGGFRPNDRQADAIVLGKFD